MHLGSATVVGKGRLNAIRSDCCFCRWKAPPFCTRCNAFYKLYTLPTTRYAQENHALHFSVARLVFLHAATAVILCCSQASCICILRVNICFLWNNVWQICFEEEEAIVKASSLCTSQRSYAVVTKSHPLNGTVRFLYSTP